MTEARHHVRASQCQGKVGFESAALAHQVNRLRSKRHGGKKNRRPPRDAYKCGHCGKWHLGRSD